jgi:hypothetical protein
MAIIVTTGQTTIVKKVKIGTPIRRVSAAGSGLATLSDVDTSTNGLVDGSILVYNSSTSRWTSTTDLEDQNINGGGY